jgi:hypothetical protein
MQLVVFAPHIHALYQETEAQDEEEPLDLDEGSLETFSDEMGPDDDEPSLHLQDDAQMDEEDIQQLPLVSNIEPMKQPEPNALLDDNENLDDHVPAQKLSELATRIQGTVSNGNDLDDKDREEVKEELANGSPNFIQEIASLEGGMALLDSIVAESEQTSFIQRLLLHVYGFEERDRQIPRFGNPEDVANLSKKRVPIESNWSVSHLKELWKAFRIVPKSHIKGPIKGLHLESAWTGGGDFNSTDKTVHLRGIPTQVTHGFSEPWTLRKRGMKHLMKNSPYSARIASKSFLNGVILHEIGHAVDTKLGIMGRFQKNPQCGGWIDHGSAQGAGEYLVENWPNTPDLSGVDNLPNVAAAKTQKDTATLNWERERDRQLGAKGRADFTHELRKTEVQKNKEYVDLKAKEENDIHVAQTGFPGGKALLALLEKIGNGQYVATAVRDIQKEFPNEFAAHNYPIWYKRALAHPLVKIMEDGAPLNGWNRERSHLRQIGEPVASGKRAFHRAYADGRWVSYEIAAKDEGVSHYQFRSPEEWFADLYAHFYMDTLTGSDQNGATHPLYEWFKTNVAKEIEGLASNDLEDVAKPKDDNQLMSSAANNPS